MIFSALLLVTSPPFFADPLRIECDGGPIDVTTGHAAPYVYDFDGDGVRDLLVGEFGSGEFIGPVHTNVEGAHKWNNGRLRFYKNYGTDFDMQLRDWEYVKAGGEIAVVPITCCVSFVPQFIDYDNDGDDDILSASYPGDMYVFLGDGDGKYASPIHLMNEDGEPLVPWEFIPEQYRKKAGSDRHDVHSTTAELHDMDADGDLDLYIGSRLDGCFTIENIGTRSAPVWSNETVLLKSKEGNEIGGWDWGSNVHWHDWDKDGISDILVGSESGGVRWYKNIGAEYNPSFAEPIVLIPDMDRGEMFSKLEVPARSASRCKVHATDWDGDGMTDLLVGDFGSSWKEIKVLTTAEENELKALEAESKKLNKMAMPLWSADHELTAEESKEKDRLDDLLDANYAKQSKLDTHSHSSHGWVWLYKQVGSEAIKTKAILSSDVDSHVSIEIYTNEFESGNPLHIEVFLDIEPGWIVDATGLMPATLDIEMPEGFTIVSTAWPKPNRSKPKTGYEGNVIISIEVSTPESLPSTLFFKGITQWQVCSDVSGVCVLERGEFNAIVQ